MLSAAEGSAVRKPEGRFSGGRAARQAEPEPERADKQSRRGSKRAHFQKPLRSASSVCGAHRLAGSDWTENGLGWTVDSGRRGSFLGSARADDGWGGPVRGGTLWSGALPLSAR